MSPEATIAAEAGSLGLDADQRLAATTPGALSVRAGPGAGKTRVLVARAANTPGSLVLTFTRAAAREILSRLPAGSDVHATTCHGWSAWWVQRNAERVGLRPGFTVRDEVEAEALWKQVGSELRMGVKTARAIAKDPKARIRYEDLLTRNNSVDYHRVEQLALNLLRRGIRPTYTEVLLDEAQDLSATQWELARLIAADGPLFAVGDPSQAIYTFLRDPDGQPVVVPDRWLGRRDAPTLELRRNYRSTVAVTKAAARLTLVPRPVAQSSVSAEPGWVGCLDDADLVEHVRNVTGGDWGGAALLGRTWSEVERGAERLAAEGIPAVVAKPGSALRTPIGRRVIAGLRCLANPADGLSLAAFAGERVPPILLAGAIDAGVPIVAHAAEHWAPAADLRDVEMFASTGVHVGDGREVAQWFARELLAPPEVVAALDQPGDLEEVIAAAIEADTRALPCSDGAVTCTTIHAAKGAEWDHVWLIGAEEPIRGDEAEERRLFYVATTRARKTCAWVARRDVPASRFVREALP